MTKNLMRIFIVFSILFIFKVAFSATLAELEVGFDQGFQNPLFLIKDLKAMELQQKIDNYQLNYEQSKLVDPADVRDISLALFIDGRPQEGIWILDRLGLVSEAEWFAEKLEKNLLTGPFEIGAAIGKGVSHSKWGKVENFPVVVKPADSNWKGSREAEIWAYHLDRILGLNLVTVAVSAKHDGALYSLHPALQQVKDSGLDFRGGGYTGEYPEIFVLDFLIQNTDRHSQNSLTSPLGFLVAIDNGRSTAMAQYQGSSSYVWNRYPNYIFDKFPRKNIINTIATIDIAEFKAEFSKFATEDVVEFITARLQILKNDFSAVATENKIRPLAREQRLAKNQLNEEEVRELRAKAQLAAEEQRRAFVASFKLELSNLVNELKSLPEGEERQYHKTNGLKLSDNGHSVMAFIDNRKENLTPRMLNSIVESLVALKDQKKIGEREVRRLVSYLYSLRPLELINAKHLAHQLEVDKTIRDMLDREDFQKDFKELLESYHQGNDNYNKLMSWLPELRTQGLTCRHLLLAL